MREGMYVVRDGVCVVREGVYGYSHGCIVKVCMFVVRVRECVGCVVVCGGVWWCVWIWVGEGRSEVAGPN